MNKLLILSDLTKELEEKVKIINEVFGKDLEFDSISVDPKYNIIRLFRNGSENLSLNFHLVNCEMSDFRDLLLLYKANYLAIKGLL